MKTKFNANMDCVMSLKMVMGKIKCAKRAFHYRIPQYKLVSTSQPHAASLFAQLAHKNHECWGPVGSTLDYGGWRV